MTPHLRRRAACLALGVWPVLASVGCATLAPPPAVPTPLARHAASLSGRLALSVAATPEHAAQSFNAAFELSGHAEQGGLDLSTPLGTVLATARWAPGEALLTLPQGQQRHSDLDALTRALLGEALPVTALFDWLRGRPWPGAPAETTATGFTQIGWAVDLSRFDAAWVHLHRSAAPEVTLRARLDR